MAELKRVLSYPVLLLIVINSIVSTGIFFLPGVGARIAGAASIWSWLILSVFTIYIATVFGELTSMFPKAGGVYEFCKQAYGRTISFFVGWLTLISGNITIAMLIIGAISYLLPAGGELRPLIMGLSSLFLLIFTVIAYRGMKTSATTLITFALITLTTLSVLIFGGFAHFETSHFEGLLTFSPAILLAVYFVAETFFGWESPTFLAGETKNGERIVPRALVHGTIIINVLALLMVVSGIGSVGAQALGNPAIPPLSTLAAANFGLLGQQIFMLITYLALIGSVAAWIISAPRLLLSLAEDKLFFPQFASIHPKHHTPHRAIIFQFVLSNIFVLLGLGSYEAVLHLLVPILLILYIFVMMSLVVLRHRKPDLPRPFRAPFGTVGPIIVSLFFVLLMGIWLTMTEGAASILAKGALLMLLGIPLYVLIEMYFDPLFIRRVHDRLARFSLIAERLTVPRSVREQTLRLLGAVRGRRVLEFGCSVGTLTQHLADTVGPQGDIIATDISAREVSIARRRMRKKGHHHVRFIHDLQHTGRLHPDVPFVDAVVSIGNLGYLQDPVKVLQEISSKLRPGGRVVFVDYDKFFDIIPNAPWLRHASSIKNMFREAGLSVRVMRKQGFAWQYIYVYGIKKERGKK